MKVTQITFSTSPRYTQGIAGRSSLSSTAGLKIKTNSPRSTKTALYAIVTIINVIVETCAESLSLFIKTSCMGCPPEAVGVTRLKKNPTKEYKQQCESFGFSFKVPIK